MPSISIILPVYNGIKYIEQSVNSVLDQQFNDFELLLEEVLPTTLGFINVTNWLPEIVLVTKTGKFSIDAVSGGVALIID